MNYNVRRGLREIVASSHLMTDQKWSDTKTEFAGRCAFCGSEATAANRGIVADHLIPVAEFGELVAGNTVPACQTCNDSRGRMDWKSFLQARFPSDAASRIAKIDSHIGAYSYSPTSPELSLTADELNQYQELLSQWENFLERAKALRAVVSARRARDAS